MRSSFGRTNGWGIAAFEKDSRESLEILINDVVKWENVGMESGYGSLARGCHGSSGKFFY